MPLRPAVALCLLALPPLLVPPREAAGATPARHHRAAVAAEVLSADDLNAMVLAILEGRPQQPEPGGSDARRRELRAAWARLRGLIGGAGA
jgi:hypothetical protein